MRAELGRLWGAQIAANETVDCDCLNGRSKFREGISNSDYFRGRMEFFLWSRNTIFYFKTAMYCTIRVTRKIM